MSENIPMSSAGDLPPDLEQTLSKLEPEALWANRDELFFQAGYAAGRACSLSPGERVGVRGPRRYFWPSAAAAMLLISLGLALIQLSGIWRAPASLSHQISSLVPSAALDQEETQWQILASRAALPPGRLTAMGWIETPAGSVDKSRSESDDNSKSLPLRPSTYLELLRIQEG